MSTSDIMLGCNLAMDLHPIQGPSSDSLSGFMLLMLQPLGFEKTYTFALV